MPDEPKPRFTGIFIPVEILNHNNLSSHEKMIISFIYQLENGLDLIDLQSHLMGIISVQKAKSCIKRAILLNFLVQEGSNVIRSDQ